MTKKRQFKKIKLYEDIDLNKHMVEKPQTWVLVAMCIPIVNIFMVLFYLWDREKEEYYEEL